MIPCHQQVEYVIERPRYKQRNNRRLCRGDLLCDRKDFHIDEYKSQRRILYQRDDLICHRRKNLLDHLREDHFKKGLHPVVSQKLWPLPY